MCSIIVIGWAFKSLAICPGVNLFVFILLRLVEFLGSLLMLVF